MLGLLVWIAMAAGQSVPDEGCTVEVVGMPVPALAHHQLLVGGEERELSPVLRLPALTEAVRLRVLGPRYRGTTMVTPEACSEDAPVRFEVEPQPARLSFPCAPQGLTVVCTGCPGLPDDQPYLGAAFPPVPMSESYRDVELLLRAPNHRRQTLELRLLPGSNSIQVRLEELPARG